MTHRTHPDGPPARRSIVVALRSLTRPQARVALPFLSLLVVLTGACASDSGSAARPATTTATALDRPGPAAGATPQPSPRAAAEALLKAEIVGDHTVSYRLLTSAARKDLPASAWSRRRNEVPAVTGFTVEKAEGDTVVTIVEHQPGLDPFVGLSPARERQTWRARQEGDGWLLDPEPTVQAMYPPAADAPPAALAWARAVQACDPAATRSHQAIDVLFGSTDAPSKLCKAGATLAVGAPAPVAAGPSSQELVAQYGIEVLDWARAVPVTGGGRPFHAVLAPIGSVWKMIGVFEQ